MATKRRRYRMARISGRFGLGGALPGQQRIPNDRQTRGEAGPRMFVNVLNRRSREVVQANDPRLGARVRIEKC
ncbi:MAG TPA: hypothetical protein VKM94_08920 [Blastocatellia bacterium]|nr:hypothetical protein [Blastocatellia bacterium]